MVIDGQQARIAELQAYMDNNAEHLTDRHENITSSILFQATLIHSTKTIKLATGTSNLSQSHPTLIAAHAAMFDHLSKGRFILGVSPGNLRADAEAIGTLDEDRNKMFAESIDVILKLWETDPPYDIDFPEEDGGPVPRTRIAGGNCAGRGRRGSRPR